MSTTGTKAGTAERANQPAPQTDRPLLDVRDLVVEYGSGSHVFRALHGVSFSVDRGGSIAIVGESGSGKSTIAKAVVRLLQPTSGQILLDGTDIAPLKPKALRPLRHRIQMVFQDPYGSLDPHQTAAAIVAEPLQARGVRSKAARRREAAELIDRVGLPSSALDRRPHEFSGGQRQRIGIARALASKPDVLVLDEATSALDVRVQATILDVLNDLRRDTEIAYIAVSHNLGVVREISEHTVVLRAGEIVESGATEEILSNPQAPYTRTLRRSALDPTAMKGRKPREVVQAIAAARAAESAAAAAAATNQESTK